jgi:hypothetical protein
MSGACRSIIYLSSTTIIDDHEMAVANKAGRESGCAADEGTFVFLQLNCHGFLSPACKRSGDFVTL